MIKNVLQYVQRTLNVMSSDKVDSIADTEESMQVAELFADLYDELIMRQDWEWLRGPITLTAAADLTSPTKFTIPANVRKVEDVFYNVSSTADVKLRKLEWLCPSDFLCRFGSKNSAQDVQVVVGNQIIFHIANDRQPTYWTTFDGITAYADAYDAVIESTLVATKVSAMGLVNPQFTIDDTFVPLLPEHMVPMMQHTLNASASLIFRQQQSVPDEQRVARQTAQARRKQSKVEDDVYYKNRWGRR